MKNDAKHHQSFSINVIPSKDEDRRHQQTLRGVKRRSNLSQHFLKIVLGEKIASPRLKIGARNDCKSSLVVIARDEVTKQSFTKFLKIV